MAPKCVLRILVARPPSRARSAGAVALAAVCLAGCGGLSDTTSRRGEGLALGPDARTPELDADDRRTVEASALEIAGGADAADGRERFRRDVYLWSDVRDAMKRAGDTDGVEVVIRRAVESDDAAVWLFDLVTAEGEPGSCRVERDTSDPRGSRLVGVRLGFDPDSEAMQARAGRLTDAFGEALDAAASRRRYVPPAD